MLCQISHHKFLTVRALTDNGLPAFQLDEVVIELPEEEDVVLFGVTIAVLLEVVVGISILDVVDEVSTLDVVVGT